MNIEDGFEIILLVKSLHHKVFPNGQFLVSLKIDFPIFYKLKHQNTFFLEFLHFSSSPTYLIFLHFSFLGYLFLKALYIGQVFILKKILILKYSPKNHEQYAKRYINRLVFLTCNHPYVINACIIGVCYKYLCYINTFYSYRVLML